MHNVIMTSGTAPISFNASSRAEKLDLLSKFCALIAIGFLPYSISGFHISLGLSCILFLGSGDLKSKFTDSLNHPVNQAFLLLFACFILSAILGVSDLGMAKGGLHKFGKFLYLLILIPVFQAKIWRERALNMYLFTISLTVFLIYLKLFGLIHVGHPDQVDHIVRNHLTTSYMVGFAAFILLHRSLNEGSYSWFYRGLLLLFIIEIEFINTGRIGYVTFFASAFLFVLQRFDRKKLFAVMAILLLAQGSLLLTSSTLRAKVSATYQNATLFHKHNNTSTSAGTRLEFLKNGLTLISQHPILGTGIGSFKQVYKTTYPNAYSSMYDHPHNTIILLGIETGLVGLALFFLFMWRLWQTSRRVEREQGFYLQGMIITFLVGGLFECVYFRSPTGYMTVCMMAVLAAGNNKIREEL